MLAAQNPFFNNQLTACDPNDFKPLLTVSGLSFSHGKSQILDGVNFTVKPGRITCLLGPSGSGKSTTLRLIAGLEKTQAGTVVVDDCLVAQNKTLHVDAHKRGVGMMFQDYALFPHLTALENVTYALKGARKSERRAYARDLLAEVEIIQHADKYPRALSGGQQQRVALARALASNPKVLLLDEPFSGLDTELRARLRDMTLHLIKQRNIAAVVVTHDPEEAMFMADWIVLMDQGKIEQQGLPQQLYFEPKSKKVVQFFGEYNQLSGKVIKGRIETELGTLKETKLTEGTELDVFVRPEALRVCPVAMTPGTQVSVEASRTLGRQSVLHLDLLSNSETHLHARVQGQFLPKDGSTFGIGLDPDMAYVFVKESKQTA